MKCLQILLILLFVYSIAYSETGKVERIDVSSLLISGLKSDQAYIDSVDVTKIIKSGKSPLDDPRLSSAVIYKIYGTIYEQSQDAPYHDKYKKYDGSPVPDKIIALSKDYLMLAAKGHPDLGTRLISMFSLGKGFVEDKEVILWLYAQLFDSTFPAAEKPGVLGAIINASRGKYEYMSDIAIKACLQSNDVPLRRAVVNNLYINKIYKRGCIKDLIASYLSEGDFIYINTLNRYLMMCKQDDVLEYRDLIEFASDLDDGRKRWMRPLLEWLSKEES